MEPDSLLALDLFRAALRTTSQSHEANLVSVSGHHDRESSDDFLRLLEAIDLGRRLVIYYNWAIVGLILLCTIWCRRHLLVQIFSQSSSYREDSRISADKKHDAALPSSSASSSSSGSATANEASDSDVHERKPLLRGRSGRKHVRSWIVRQTHSLQGWLMHQPRNLPFDKVLPSNLTTIFIVVWLALNLFVLSYRVYLPGQTLFLIAMRTGGVFTGNLPILYFLAAKNCPIRFLTGLSYENLNIFHRRLGEWLCLLAAAHFATMTVVFWTFNATRGLSMWIFFSHPIVWIGIVAFSCYEILYFTSLASFRQRWYELFLASHIILQAGGLGFLYFHFPTTKIWVLITAAIFLVDRCIYRLFLNRRTITADLTVLPDQQTLLLSANWMIPAHPSFWARHIKNDIATGWHPTAHIFISCPSLSKTSALQSHPFTIASAAPNPSRHAKLDLLVRARDGFTSALLSYAQTHSRISLSVDGPYGSTHALHLAQRADITVLVAGGSGIAVTFPIAWALSHGSARPRNTIVLVWITHSASHVHWLGQDRLDDLAATGVRLVMPVPTAQGGRPDMCALMDDAIVPSAEGDADAGRRVGVVVSGPDGMNREVRNWCARAVREGRDVGVAVEKFGW